MESRYEEYTHSSSSLPCTIRSDMERTMYVRSTRTNWHENLELQWCNGGEGVVLLDGRKYELRKECMIIANSNVVHYTYSDTFLNYSCMILDAGFAKAAKIDFTELEFEECIYDQELISLLKEAEFLYQNSEDACQTAKLQRVILQILILLFEKYRKEKRNVSETDDSFEDMKKTIKYLREHYLKKLTLEQIARNVYTDKYSLSRKFKALTGQTVIQYLNNYRCQRAMELLRAGKSVSEAAVLCGFHNTSFFIKTFQKYTGNRPSQYKKK